MYGRRVPAFVMRRWDLQPYPFPQAPLHVHEQGDEGFIVLSGLLDVTLGSEVKRLEPGEFVLVEAGTPHTFATVEDTAASVLVAMTPDVDALVRELHQVPEDEHPLVWARYKSWMA
jgi:quercetin dioxygenase-like cupin family protein